MSVHNQQESPAERRKRLCAEFAAERQAGKSSSIEDYLGRLPDAEQSELLTELIRQDHVLGWQTGEPPTLRQYQSRFADRIEAVARGCFAPPSAGGVRYALVCLLAEGSQATVYLARDNDNGAVVVVKGARECSEKVAQQFQQEAHLLKQAQHPLIVPILDDFVSAGRAFIVLQYVRGTTLAQKLKSDGPLAPPDAARIIEQIADAVHSIHQGLTSDGKELVHCDLKPAHIILSQDDGQPRLLDFGLANYAEGIPGTRSTAHHGTLEYMAPEQIAAFLHGAGHVDRRTDVWALGAILFELLTAQRPFGTRPQRESFASIEQWASAVEKYLAPRAGNDGASVVPGTDVPIPEPLGKIVARCVEKRPDARYQTASQLADALRASRESVEDPKTE